MPKFKVKERILKETREKQELVCKGADFSTETLQDREMVRTFPSNGKQRPATKTQQGFQLKWKAK